MGVKSEEMGGLPVYLENLFARSCQCLDDAQVLRLRQLQERYADVFSAGDLDLRCTDLVEGRENAQQIMGNAILDKDLTKVISAQKQEQISHLQKFVDVGKVTRKEVDDVKSIPNVRIVKLNEKGYFLEMEHSEKEVNMEICLVR
ncbi:Hypothetical predicted protein [Octopus vulgaris]|uniref:Uncharacterized protein n=1 Tax=Octopus vulgaris TaxID=6645 RepID=A0AA36BIY9_OCTVU|nr:Hypothetical predicted protein [Octopus vulgaris]